MRVGSWELGKKETYVLRTTYNVLYLDLLYSTVSYHIQVQVPARCAISEQCVCCGKVGACS